MPFCGHCGNKLSDYDIYCTYCGTRVEQPEAEDTSMRGVVMFQRESSFSAKLMKTSVTVDDKEYGKLGEGESLSVHLPAGTHTVELKATGNPSATFQITVDPNGRKVVFPFKIGAGGRAQYCGSDTANAPTKMSKSKGWMPTIVAVLIFIVALMAVNSAFSSSKNTSKTTSGGKTSVSETTQTATSSKNNNEESVVEIIEDTTNTQTSANEKLRLDETVIYNTEIATVTVKGIRIDNSYFPSGYYVVDAEVKNNSDEKIYFSSSQIVVNGFSLDSYTGKHMEVRYFMSGQYEAKINSKMMNYSYIFPTEEVNEYIHEVCALPVKDILQYILLEPAPKVSAKDVFQFSNFDDATTRICQRIAVADNPGFKHVEVGEEVMLGSWSIF